MCAYRADDQEKPPQSKKANTGRNSPTTGQPSLPQGNALFVHTQIYNELYKMVQDCACHKSIVNNIQVIGPKGVGKTWALRELARAFEDVQYVDLSIEMPQPLQSEKKILLIDNAQKVTQNMGYDGIREKTIVAAFSPGARVRDGCKILGKMCGDGRHQLFFWRPFTWDEAQELISKLGYTIDEKTNLEEKKISKRRLRSLYCKTNGIPRYIDRYFWAKNLSFMMHDLEEQYKSMVSKETREALDMDSNKINTEISALLSTGKCFAWDPPSVLGCAYSTTSCGIKEWKPAHPYYMYKALKVLGNPLKVLDWQRLETLTQVMLRADVVVSGKNGSLSVKGADTVLYQDRIGSIPPEIQIEDGSVILLILALNHNVLDSILYDLRGNPKRVYFVQTSSTEYSRKKKKLRSLADKVKDGGTELSRVSIKEHYTDILKGTHEQYYIYATTDLTGSKSHRDVYFMDLLAFCPNYSSIYEVGDSGSESD